MSFESPELEDAWQRTSWNNNEVRKSTLCVCLACEAYFPSTEVKWRLIDGRIGEGLSSVPLSDMTAVCPNCSQTTVLGDDSGFPIQNPAFVSAMADHVVRMKGAIE